jgi:hypothetical protein
MDSWMIHVVLNKQITDHPLVTPLFDSGWDHPLALLVLGPR